jgi:hypothetical protein
MSRHWKPDAEVDRVRKARVTQRWPEGAAVGLTMVAVACAGMVLVLYRMAGPRDVFGP